MEHAEAGGLPRPAIVLSYVICVLVYVAFVILLPSSPLSGQIRPGMDLSKLSFPVFVLEPRSFLDKMSDTFRHAHFFTEAALAEVRRPLAVHLYSIFVAGTT